MIYYMLTACCAEWITTLYQFLQQGFIGHITIKFLWLGFESRHGMLLKHNVISVISVMNPFV